MTLFKPTITEFCSVGRGRSLDFGISTKTHMAVRSDFKREKESFQFVCFGTEMLMFLFPLIMLGFLQNPYLMPYSPRSNVWVKT